MDIRGWCRRRFGTGLTFLIGAAIGAAALATCQASGVVSPPPAGGNVAAEAESDIILTIREPYLSRLAAEQTAGLQLPVPLEDVRVDLLPGRHVRLLGNVRFMGQRVELAAPMTVAVNQRQVRLAASTLELGALAVPIDLDQLVAEPINREAARLVADGRFEVVDVTTTNDQLILRLTARQ
jgi:hypothetical protein